MTAYEIRPRVKIGLARWFWRQLNGYYLRRRTKLLDAILAAVMGNQAPLEAVVAEIHEFGDAQPGELQYLWMWAQGVGR